MIERTLQAHLLVVDCRYPVVTLTGPRQSGKTTLSRMAFPEKPYASLEPPATRELAMEGPLGFLARYPGGAICDEVHLRLDHGTARGWRFRGNPLGDGEKYPRAAEAPIGRVPLGRSGSAHRLRLAGALLGPVDGSIRRAELSISAAGVCIRAAESSIGSAEDCIGAAYDSIHLAEVSIQTGYVCIRAA